MPLRDWSKVDDGFFHDFHNDWLGQIKRTLNSGVLPKGYFAMTEQYSEGYFADVLAFTKTPRRPRIAKPEGGVALAEPETKERVVAQGVLHYPHRRLTVRLTGSRYVVAVIELVSPSNKDRRESVGDFAGKVADLLWSGTHVLVIDVLPPNRSCPQGMHAAIWSKIEGRRVETSVPVRRPLLVAGYRSMRKPIAYLEYTSVGKSLPDGPLYLDTDLFVNVPLEAIYQTVYDFMPVELKEAKFTASFHNGTEVVKHDLETVWTDKAVNDCDRLPTYEFKMKKVEDKEIVDLVKVVETTPVM